MSTVGEGWGVIRPGDRKAHYYRDTMSLCGRVGFYQGPLDPDEFASKDDCAACRKALARETAKAAAGCAACATPEEASACDFPVVPAAQIAAEVAEDVRRLAGGAR